MGMISIKLLKKDANESENGTMRHVLYISGVLGVHNSLVKNNALFNENPNLVILYKWREAAKNKPKPQEMRLTCVTSVILYNCVLKFILSTENFTNTEALLDGSEDYLNQGKNSNE